jgi:hypothetical protein
MAHLIAQLGGTMANPDLSGEELHAFVSATIALDPKDYPCPWCGDCKVVVAPYDGSDNVTIDILHKAWCPDLKAYEVHPTVIR